MIININLFSLSRFLDLYDKNEYLQKVLIANGGNSYTVETDDTTEIRRLLYSNRIKYTTE